MAVNKAKALKAADKYIAKQNYNKALNELLKVIKVSPNDANLLNKIGDLYNKLGKNSNAIEYFQKVAESYQKGGFNLKAIALYKKIIRIDERYMDARHRLVDLYIQQGYNSETKGELRRMAEHYYSEDLFPRALDCYEKMVELEPHNLDARIKITEILVREGRRDDATGHFVAMGRELLDKSMLNEAKKIISQGLKMAPKDKGLLLLLSRTFISEGKTDEALTHLTEICQDDVDNLEALRLLGKTYMDKGHLADAQNCFLRAIMISADETGSLEELARKFIEQDTLEDAYACLLPVSEIYIQRQEFEEATRQFRTILYADENHLPAQEKLVEIYRASQQTANAVLSLEKIIHVLLNRHEEDAARQRIEELLELEPNNQEWREKLNQMRANQTGADLEDDEIHVWDEPAVDDVALDDGSIEVDLSGKSDHVDSGDTEAAVANHLTEAEVFIKYGIMDQALEHLEKAKDLDFLNVDANIRLKRIYLDKNMIQKAVPCMVSLVNVCIEKKDFRQARLQLQEIAQFEPEIARIHQGRIEALMRESGHIQTEEDGAFALDFNDKANTETEDSAYVIDAESSAGLLFEAPNTNQEVVEYREMAPGGGTVALPGEAAGQDGEGWSLDMPASDEEVEEAGGGGFAEDFQDLYNVGDQTGVEGADELPSLDALGEDSRLDLSLTNMEALHDPEALLGHGTAPADLRSKMEEEGLLDEDDAVPDAIEEASPEPEEAVEDEPEKATPVETAPLPPETKEDGTFELGADLNDAVLELEESMTGMGSLSDVMADEKKNQEEVPAENKHAPLHSSHGSLAGELEEIDFFISVEAFEDARNLIEDARQHFGEHPLLMERMREVQAKTQSAPQPMPKSSSSPNESEAEPAADPFQELADGAEGPGFFDLAAELNEELFEESGEVNDATSQEEIQSVEELFQEFKKGVEEQIDEGDHETHYDLGIAYKEMGLLEEAIAEFEKASRAKNLFLECCTMIGNCQIELGRVEETIAHYEKHLQDEDIKPEMVLAINYELALAYQGLGELEKALEILRTIEETDSEYRDVPDLIQALV